MGSVQRLATVVVLGLVGLASVLILYLADESNRIDQFAEQQQEAAVERGQATYLSQCLACHGPAGEGYTAQGEAGTGRIGAPLGGINTTLNQTGMTADGNPWSDPLNPQFGNGLQGRYNFIVWRVHNGIKKPDGSFLMPAFGAELNGSLNDSQIQELATFIQHADWNEVYNAAVAQYGGYPTAAPKATAVPEATTGADTGNGGNAGASYEIDMQDILFNPSKLEIPAGQDVHVTLKNTGNLEHNFSIPSQNISHDVPAGSSMDIVLNLPAGTYDFDCDVPGHKEAGMVGTLTVTEGLAPPAGSGGGEATPGATGGDQGAAPAPIEIDLEDILFAPNAIEIPANTDVTLVLKNTGALPHNLSIPSENISQDVAAGETVNLTVNLPAGTYDFDCDEPGHKEAGMVGTLTVTEGSAAPAATEAAPSTSGETTPAANTAGPIELDMQDIVFVPNTFSIPANTDVTIALKNTGALPHDFSIPSENISHTVAPGASQDITLNLPAGTYDFICAEPGHKEAGMVGTLTVTEGSAAPAATEVVAATSGEATPDARTVGPVLLDMQDILFVPKDFTIPSNTDVKVTLRNSGVLPHDFSIPTQNLSYTVAPGDSEDIILNLPAGTYDFICAEPGHKEAGMVGTLTVADNYVLSAASPVASPAASPEAGGPIEIDMKDILFVPNEFTIAANTDVKVTLKNTGALPHTFTIPGTDVNYVLQSGETKEIVLNLAAGTYPFDCAEPGHKEAGMVGTLTVK